MLNDTFKVTYLVGIIVATLIRGRMTWPFRGERVKISWQPRFDSIMLAVIGVGMAVPIVYSLTSWIDFADYALPDAIGWAGTAVFATSCYLLWRSHADLGKNWSPVVGIKQDQALVTTGIFTHVRHPMYAAHLVWAIGQLLMLHNWIAGPSFLVTLLPQYLCRVGREEQMMLETFGDEYADYMKRTGRLLPRFTTKTYKDRAGA